MSKRYIKLAVFVLAVLVTLTGCKSSAEKEQGPKPVAVEVKPVERGEVQAGTVLSGPVRAQAEVYVISKLPLQVLAVKVQVGDREAVRYCCNLMIRSGTTGPASQSRFAAEADAAGKGGASRRPARLAYENAAADLTRMEYLKEQGVISEQALSKPESGRSGGSIPRILDQEKWLWPTTTKPRRLWPWPDPSWITPPLLRRNSGQSAGGGANGQPYAPVATIVAMDQVKISLMLQKDISHLRTDKSNG